MLKKQPVILKKWSAILTALFVVAILTGVIWLGVKNLPYISAEGGEASSSTTVGGTSTANSFSSTTSGGTFNDGFVDTNNTSTIITHPTATNDIPATIYNPTTTTSPIIILPQSETANTPQSNIIPESISYDFDTVDVRYAAEFTALPFEVSPESWVAKLAGGADKPITVLYGVVSLYKNGASDFNEEFIKIIGPEGSERFLHNSASNSYYPDTNNLKEARTFFWSVKKLIDNSVVKDFTPPIKSISLLKKFDENKNLNSIVLSFSDDGYLANQNFWKTSEFTENVYNLETGSLIQAGAATSSSEATSSTETAPIIVK